MSEPMNPEEHPEQLSDGFPHAGLAAAFGPDSNRRMRASRRRWAPASASRCASGRRQAQRTPPWTPPPHRGYELQGEIGRGGMGVCCKGRDTDLGRDVAVKVLLETHQGDPELVRRFIEEAQIAGQLQHPGVVPVYETGPVRRRPAVLHHEAGQGPHPR